VNYHQRRADPDGDGDLPGAPSAHSRSPLLRLDHLFRRNDNIPPATDGQGSEGRSRPCAACRPPRRHQAPPLDDLKELKEKDDGA
jgi:hypothetical protein